LQFLGAYDQPPLQLHVTEYLPQGSLRDFLERIPSDEPVRYPERLRMARDIACGLEYLHSLGILHRDCKSENMVIAADGTVKLTDFGIARMEGEPEHMTSETGTYRYMAPEVRWFYRGLTGHVQVFWTPLDLVSGLK
jgi:serine/threonine protein kinase